MADLTQLETALRNAHSAGDEAGARALAAEIIRQRGQTKAPAPASAQIDPSEGEFPFSPFGIDTGLMMPQGVSRFLAGAGKAFTDLGRGVGQLTGNVSQQEIDEAKRRDAPLMNTTGGTLGNIAGNVALAAPTAFVPGANTVTGSAVVGGILGALQPTATGESRGSNMAVGAGGGGGGAAAAKVLGRLVRPVQSELSPELSDLAKKAKDAGIPLDAADITGSRPLKVIRSVFESLPLTADKQAAINEAKRAAFNRAVLQNVGESADKATPEVLNAARTRIGGEFNRLTQNQNIPLGDGFLNTLGQIDANTTPFSSSGIRGAVNNGLDLAQRGTIDGRTYQNVRSVLGKRANDAFKGSDSELGGALKSIRKALDDEAGNALSGADKDAWQAARNQWQNLKVVEKAAAPTSADAVAGNVSPAKLAQALAQIDRKGYTYGTRGDNMGDLARIGQAFVKDQIPNSGTAERTFMTRLLTGNPIETLWQTGVGGISMPAQAAINSKAGQAYLTNGLLPKNARTQMIANILRQGAIGTGAGGSLLLANPGE